MRLIRAGIKALFGNYYEKRRLEAAARAPRTPYAIKTEEFEFDVRWIANGKTNRYRMPLAVPARSVVDGRWTLLVDGALAFFRANFDDDCLVLDGWVNGNIEVRLTGTRSLPLNEMILTLQKERRAPPPPPVVVATESGSLNYQPGRRRLWRP